MSQRGRRNWVWNAARCAILVAAALACPLRGYSRGRVILPTDMLTASKGLGLGNAVGSSEAISADGTVLVVGAPTTTVTPTGGTAVSGAGAAYVFLEPASGWGSAPAQSIELTVAQNITNTTLVANAHMGASVAINSDGSIIVVGAPGDNGGAGAAWVFTEPTNPGGWSSVSTWSQSNELTAAGGASGDLFGTAVGIYGNSTSGATIVVGASNQTVTFNAAPVTGAGAAYVFSYSPTAGASQLAELTNQNPSASEAFGTSIAISTDGSTIIVGAPGYLSSQGAAYVFTAPSGTWAQLIRLTASDGLSGDNFGASLAINRATGTGVTDTAVVGAPGYLSSQGAAYVFTAPGGTWAQVAELTAKGSTSGSELGASVAISGDTSTIVAGAPGAPPASTGSYSQGTMFQFDQPSKGQSILPWANENPSETFEYTKSSQTSSGNNIGGSAAVFRPSGGNSSIFAGAPNLPQTNSTVGAIYLFSGK